MCRRSFTRERDLDRHKRTVQCGGPPQPGPAPKRRRIASLDEDPVSAPPIELLDDDLSAGLRDFVHENWAAIRTHVVTGPIQTRYNHRLTSLDTRDLHEPLRVLFDQQTTAFKINCSFAFILKNKTTNRLKYYHSSNNCCGRLLEEPALITNRGNFDRFLERIHQPGILQWAVAQRPNSDWICEMVTNATFFVNRIEDYPIGCVGVNLPDYVKNNKAIVGLTKDEHGVTYNVNLCLFRCLALHRGCDVRRLETTVVTLYAKYTDIPVHDFAGVRIEDVHEVETKFKTNVVIYQLVKTPDGKTVAELVRRSPAQYPETMYLNLYEAHFSYIKDIRMYSHSYKCSKCEQALWKSSWELHSHERTCEAGVNKIVDHPIGCVGVNLPTYVKNNKSIIGLETDSHGVIYIDNLCLFRCLGLHLGREAAALYAEYTDTPVRHFAGVTLDELDKVETTFKTNVFVYKLVEIADGKTTAELVRRSMGHYTETMYLNLYEAHFSYIKDIRMYSHSYKCSKCEQALWKSSWELHRHERTCEAGVNQIYKGGVYRPPASIFERLDDEGIIASPVLRYFPYRATFDFECYFSDERLPVNSDKLQWSARHVPLSVSVASNVPGYEPAQCYITDGDSDKLVADMMDHLTAISDAAYESLLPLYADVLEELKTRKEAWDEEEEEE